jgi:hypothetical protein
MREALVEDARLHGERKLGGDEGGFQGTAGAQGERGEPKGHEEGEGGAEEGKGADGNEDAFTADAEGREGDDFAVHGHAAEAEKDSDEYGHGDGENQDAGDDAEEDGGDLRGGTGVADEDFHEADELGDEEYKGKDEEAEEGVAGDFAGDVTVEDAHRAKGECNMGRIASDGGAGKGYQISVIRRRIRTPKCKSVRVQRCKGETQDQVQTTNLGRPGHYGRDDGKASGLKA